MVRYKVQIVHDANLDMMHVGNFLILLVIRYEKAKKKIRIVYEWKVWWNRVKTLSWVC